jgi:hypothetical protein
MKLKLILFVIIFLIYASCSSRKNDVSTNHNTTEKVYKMAKPMPKPEPKPEPVTAAPALDSDKDGVVDVKDIELDMTAPTPTQAPVPITGVKPLIKFNADTITPININSVSKGDINYVLQDTMVVGVVNEVNMTISVGVDKKDIISQIKTFTDDNLHTESVRISPVMKARLVDASGGVNFKIVEKSGQEQFLEYGEITRWTWEVTPLVKGNNNLSLVVDVILNDKIKTIQVYDGVIYVYSDKTIIQIISTFLLTYWQYLLSTLLLPFGIYLYQVYSKRKKENI